MESYPRRVTPVITQCIGDELYVRVHRRVGEDRLLSDRELRDWAERIVAMPVKPKRVWMLWNTNWEMQAIENGQKLEALLPPTLVVNWKQLYLEAQKANPGSLFSFFKVGAAKPGAAASAKDHDDDDDDDNNNGVSPKKQEGEAKPSPNKRPTAPAAVASAPSPQKKAKPTAAAEGSIASFFTKK